MSRETVASRGVKIRSTKDVVFPDLEHDRCRRNVHKFGLKPKMAHNKKQYVCDLCGATEAEQFEHPINYRHQCEAEEGWHCDECGYFMFRAFLDSRAEAAQAEDAA